MRATRPAFASCGARCSSSWPPTATRSDDDELVESDVIMPPRDVSFEEARGEFTGEGLIPD